MRHKFPFAALLGGRASLFGGSFLELFPGGTAPEIELICLACRRPLAEQDALRLGVIAAGALDWPFIRDYSLKHGVFALVYQNLKGLDPSPIPHQFRESWGGQFRDLASWNLYNSVELVKILKLLEAHGIEAIPFKGPVFTAETYGDLRLRASSDLDILIHKRDAGRARSLLEGAGFRLKPPFPGAGFADLLNQSKDMAFHREDRIVVEVHWELALPSKPLLPPAEVFWQSTTPARLHGCEVRQFTTENMFLLLCVHHGLMHNYITLLLACDIAQFLGAHAGRLDWRRLMDRARQWDCLRPLLLGCLMARLVHGTSLPDPVLVLLRKDAYLQGLAGRMISNLFHDSSGLLPLGQTFELYLRSKTRWRDRLRIIRQLVFVPRAVDRAFVKLPPVLHCCYPLVRAVRLALSYFLGKTLD